MGKLENATANVATEPTVIAVSNVRKSNAKLLGQLTQIIGKDGSYELFSSTNFKGTNRIWIKGFKANSVEHDWIFTCSKQLSADLRACETEEEFDELLDEIEFANVTMEVRHSKTHFDSKGEPEKEVIYYLGFGDSGEDMSSTRKKSSGSVKEVTREKKTITFNDLIAGQV